VSKQTLHYAPDYAVAPGEILQEALVDRQMTQAELARRTDRPLKTINEIVNGQRATHRRSPRPTRARQRDC